MSKLIIILLCLLGVVIIGGVLVWQLWPKNNGVACTMEAKLCPDGSSVGRIAPDCEFAECPVWNNITNANGFSIQYPIDFKVNVEGIEVDETTAPIFSLYNLTSTSFIRIESREKEGIYDGGDTLLETIAKDNFEANQRNKYLFNEVVDPISLTDLNGNPAYTYTIISKGFSGKGESWGWGSVGLAEDEPMKIKVIESENNGQYFLIVYTPDDQQIDQILSTFKFINQ